MIRLNLNHAGLYIVTANSLVSQFDALQKPSQGKSDDLGNAKPGKVLQFGKNLNICGSKADGGGLALAPGKLHRPNYLTAAKRYRKGSTAASLDESLLVREGPTGEYARQLEGALVGELVRLLASGQVESENILAYLASAEQSEQDIWARDDIRLAWLTVLYAARGYDQPWVYAFCMTFGKHPSKAIPIWQERRDRWASMGLAEMENYGDVRSQRNDLQAAQVQERPMQVWDAAGQASAGSSQSSGQAERGTSPRETGAGIHVANLYLTAAQEIEKPSPVSVPRRKVAA